MRIALLLALVSIGCTPKPEGENPGDCSDGDDNDRDGDIDCADSSCGSADECAPEDTGDDTPCAVSTGTDIGDVAPDFALQDSNGDTFHLKDYCSNLVLVIFDTSWDGPGYASMAQGWYALHGGEGFQPIAILTENSTSGEPSTADLDVYKNGGGLAFPVLADPGGVTLATYVTGNFDYPYCVLYDPGLLISSKNGQPNQQSIEDHLGL